MLETGEVQRVGSLESRKSDVHVIAATNRDLMAEVNGGRFRADLFYRLNVVEIVLPPLRDRREDIPFLTASFVRDASVRFSKRLVGLTPGAERLLAGAPWKGNIRELRNAVERASMLAESEFITERDLGAFAKSAQAAASSRTVPTPDESDHTDEAAVDIDRELLERVLSEVNGNKKLAADRLGISRRALYRLLERHSLDSSIQRRPVAGPS